MKYLGVDWGLKKIGLAVSQGNLASPFGVLKVNSLDEATSKILSIVQKEEIDQIIIGKPEGQSGRLVDKATKELEKLGLNVIQTDETLSTYEAKVLMLELGAGQKSRKGDDAVSAAIILQRYLDEDKA